MGGLSQFGIRAVMDPMEGLEEMIVRAILVALREGQGIALLRVPHHLRKVPPNTS